MAHEHQLSLPTLVIGRADALRLQRELEALNDYLYQAGLRAGGEQAKLPKTSRVLDEFTTTNKLNMLLPESRKASLEFMDIIVDKAPVVHMSFAVEPSSAFRQKLIVWWRQNVHGYVLMDVGLQPNIAIGTVVRTANKQYDFSLRKHFADNKDVLVKLLQAGKAV
jgi:hypothetical protein